MKLTNTLTSKHTELSELGLNPGDTVTLYSCGPTVYNHVHIGNLRTFIADDMLRRNLIAAGYKVNAVMNITDVDDKTIAKSQTEHPDLGPMEALIETTRAYEAIFMSDLAAVGVDTSIFTIVRATEQIGPMQAMIADIMKHGFAYIAEGSVYFDLAKYQAAGNTYGQLINVDFSPQARVDNDEYDKNEARDFVLWKGMKEGEPFWEFALDGHDLPGRPGWHIECSAMALANLHTQPITIHSGGIDLKFPHHENEIAQTIGATGQPFTQIFTHHGHLFVDGRKMSKSLDNFYTLEDIVAEGYHPLAFRLLTLQASHTSELNFSWDSLDAAQNSLGSLYGWADLRHQTNLSELRFEPSVIDDTLDHMTQALADDLSSTAALAVLYRFVAELAPGMRYDEEDSAELFGRIDALLGLGLSDRSDINADQKKLIAERQTAREAKDYAASDRFRAQLERRGLEISDTPNGPRWRRLELTKPEKIN
ncbi:cysteine--tRNA ligase [Candidatus Saccharibacteria bacterium]|nr:cysteine--tRNA ligase [Candidatus Saccharibacteria bacterium]